MADADPLAPLIRTPRVREFRARFAPLMAAHGFVRRADFLPEQIPRLLGNLVLLERTERGFRYRLVGSNIAGLHGRDLTGSYLSEWPAATSSMIAAQYEALLAHRRPILAHYLGPAYSGGRFHIVQRRWEKLALPLAFGAAADGVLVCADQCGEADAWPDCFAGTPDRGCWCLEPGVSQRA